MRKRLLIHRECGGENIALGCTLLAEGIGDVRVVLIILRCSADVDFHFTLLHLSEVLLLFAMFKVRPTNGSSVCLNL